MNAMTLARFLSRLLLPALLGLAGGCAAADGTAAPSRGHLLIMGGAISDRNALVYGRFFDLVERTGDRAARIGVVPTASGVENPGASTVETLTTFAAAHGRSGHTIEVIPVFKDTPDRAHDPGIVAQVRACRALWFTGGAQSRIIDVFRPGGTDTPAAAACREVLARGGTIAGTSAGAAMMSDPMIRNGSSANALRYGVITGSPTDEDDARGVGVGPGMGFFPYGFTDQHFLQRGRLGRLVVALEHAGQPRGFGIAENSAIDVDLSTGRIEALGPCSVLLVERSAASADGDLRRGVRLSLLSTGDTIDARTGKVSTARPPLRASAPAPTPEAAVPPPWARNVVTALIRRLAAGEPGPVVARDDSAELRLEADDRTRFFADPRDGDALTAVDVRMDLRVVR